MVQIFAGFNLSFALEGSGVLWQWGNSNFSPSKVDPLHGKGTRHVECSEDWAIALTGFFFVNVYSETNSFMTVTLVNKMAYLLSFPQKVLSLLMQNVEGISCGIQHYALKLSNGNLVKKIELF